MTEISDINLALDFILVFIAGLLFGFIIDNMSKLKRAILNRITKETKGHDKNV